MARRSHRPDRRSEVRRPVALDLAGLGHLADCHSSQLTRGQHQRVAVARIVAVEPKL